jgi:uncharacterized protein (TIGR02118 family)
MIKVSVMYPFIEGATFDMDYYIQNHMPTLRKKLGSSCKRTEVDQGLAGGAPGSQPVYTAAAHLLFESLEAFQAAFAPHAASLMADVANYTNIEPVVQISEVKPF